METLGILIGRFQPFHLGHDSLLQEALRHCDKIMIIIGSAQRARTIKNPWTFDERCQMIRATYPHLNLHFAGIPDYFYDELAWTNAVQHAVNEAFPKANKILFGHSKDETSYYLQAFTTWTVHECPDFLNINATEIRQHFFLTQQISKSLLPEAIQGYLQDFLNSEHDLHLRQEMKYITEYQHSWSQTPYPPIFATVDALVICAHSILLIQRGLPPGKGLLALPGGFLEAQEWIQTGIIRELKEETRIALSDAQLKQALKTIEIYDYPGRSNIGRMITHVGLFILDSPPPHTQAADDAQHVSWHPLQNLEQIQDQFHDDHYLIIRHLLAQQGLLKWV